MNQPWIENKKSDLLFILFPPFLVLGFVFALYDKIISINDIFIWFFIVVMIDVAHVYATLFKSFFNSEESSYFKKLFLIIPAICFIGAIILFQIGEHFYWRTLAYIALFHFIRQQYGFFKLYTRAEPRDTFNYKLGILSIYSATIHPMIYWFFGPKRNFNWFVENDFILTPNPHIISLSWILFIAIQSIYIYSQLKEYALHKKINIPKNLVWLGTLLSWNFGIIYFNNDIVFSLLNIVSHGIPYIALVFFTTIAKPETNHILLVSKFANLKTKLLLFFIVIFVLGVVEEFVWDYIVWNEHIFQNRLEQIENYFWIIVPLLSLPQITHYILDGFLWKKKTL